MTLYYDFSYRTEKTRKYTLILLMFLEVGGRERIRTSGTVTRTPDFESGAFNHSATLPTVDFQALTLVRTCCI